MSNTQQNYNADGHGANNWPLRFDLNVSTHEGNQGGESEFQVLHWALTEYKESRLKLMEHWRYDKAEEGDEEPDEYTTHVGTLQTIDELLTSLALGLCDADQKRVQSLSNPKADAAATGQSEDMTDNQQSKGNGADAAHSRLAELQAENFILRLVKKQLELIYPKGGPTDGR